MTDPILDSRGYFWLADRPLPDGHFAPPDSVTGRLSISHAGRISLDLDGHLSGNSDLDAVLSKVLLRGPMKGAIAGVLIGTDASVWLGDLVANGANARLNGPSTEAYLAYKAIVSPEPVWDERHHSFKQLELPLDGFESWLCLNGLRAERTPRGYFARYVKPKIRRWAVEVGKLEFQRQLEGILPGTGRARIDWNERALFRLTKRQPFSIEEAVDLARKIEDLVILLTDSNRGLDFPRLRLKDKAASVRLYYPRMERGAEPVSWHRSWATFPDCEPSFGSMLDAWLALHDQMGPGVHLYLGNRRGHPMYPEHRFVSLVWGLEALHRKSCPTAPDQGIAEKIKRILSGIALEKDRKWVKRFLPKGDEPSLAMRLEEILLTLPLRFKSAELRAFCSRCADRRNDISHFGGRRNSEDNESFLNDIVSLSPALAIFYHALLLKMTGIPVHLIQRQFHGGPNSYQSSEVLRRVGICLEVAIDEAELAIP